MIAPEMIEAVVIEKSRNAPQNTPFRRCQYAAVAASTPPSGVAPDRWVAISGLQGVAQPAAVMPPVKPGPLGNAK